MTLLMRDAASGRGRRLMAEVSFLGGGERDAGAVLSEMGFFRPLGFLALKSKHSDQSSI